MLSGKADVDRRTPALHGGRENLRTVHFLFRPGPSSDLIRIPRGETMTKVLNHFFFLFISILHYILNYGKG